MKIWGVVDSFIDDLKLRGPPQDSISVYHAMHEVQSCLQQARIKAIAHSLFSMQLLKATWI